MLGGMTDEKRAWTRPKLKRILAATRFEDEGGRVTLKPLGWCPDITFVGVVVLDGDGVVSHLAIESLPGH
jgi:hypothetical protein